MEHMSVAEHKGIMCGVSLISTWALRHQMDSFGVYVSLPFPYVTSAFAVDKSPECPLLGDGRSSCGKWCPPLRSFGSVGVPKAMPPSPCYLRCRYVTCSGFPPQYTPERSTRMTRASFGAVLFTARPNKPLPAPISCNSLIAAGLCAVDGLQGRWLAGCDVCGRKQTFVE